MNAKSFQLNFKFDGDFVVNGRPLILTMDTSERAHLTTGLRVWDGGIVLAKYLERYVPQARHANGNRQLQGLELGAGTGVAGLSFALLGQSVVLSDVAGDQAAATQANITLNKVQVASARGNICFKVVDWRSLPERSSFGFFDIVFAGDVIWHESLVEPFVQALTWTASGPGVGEVLLSHKARDAESIHLFERLIAETPFVIERKVQTTEFLGGQWGHPQIDVYHLRPRRR